MWYVVLFTAENTISAIPSQWYVEESEECLWPPSSTKKVEIWRYVKQKQSPDENWKPYKVKILGAYIDYKEAMHKLGKAREKDKLSTTEDEEVGRGKRKRKVGNTRFTHDFDLSNESESMQSTDDETISYPKIPSKATEKLIEKNNQVGTKNTQQTTTKKQNPLFEVQKGTITQSFSFECGVGTSKDKSPEVLEKTCEILQLLEKINNENSEFRQQVFRKLNIINIKLNDLEASVERLNATNERTEDQNQMDDLTDILNSFPLNNETKLELNEISLADPDKKRRLAKELSRVGGLNAAEIVKRVMYKVFSNQVGHLYSWDGAKGKKKFKTLKISNVILDAVRLNNNTKNATESEVTIEIKKWLVRCKNRMHPKRPRLNAEQEINHASN